MDHKEAIASQAAERYILNELPEHESERFEEHYFNCTECAENVRCLAGISEALRDPAESSSPARSSGWLEMIREWWARPLAGAIAAVALLWLIGLSAYQARELRQQFRGQATVAYLLLPESRGELPTLSLKDSGQVLVLEADLPGAIGELKWDLRPASGSKATGEGNAPAPKPGSNLKVIVPAEGLAPGDYVLSVRMVSGGAPWLFRFKVV